MENPALPVVCALIERDSRVLLAQRPAHKHLALKWEFPGGKIDPGETAEARSSARSGRNSSARSPSGAPSPLSAHLRPHTIEMIPFVCSLTPESPEPQPASTRPSLGIALGVVCLRSGGRDRPVVRMYQAGAGKTTC